MQPLTTEQTELLLIIYEIEEFDKEHPGNIPDGGIGRIIVENGIMSAEEFNDLSERLEEYGYLHNEDELTTNGKQYVELFKEYLEQKEKNPALKNNSYSLINIENLGNMLEVKTGNSEVLSKLSVVINLIKRIGTMLHK